MDNREAPAYARGELFKVIYQAFPSCQRFGGLLSIGRLEERTEISQQSLYAAMKNDRLGGYSIARLVKASRNERAGHPEALELTAVLLSQFLPTV